MFNRKYIMISLVVLGAFIAYNAFAIPRHNNDPHSVFHKGNHTFDGDVNMTGDVNMSGGFELDGLADVNGDAVCVESDGDFGTCGAAVFTTSVSSPILQSPLTGGSDNILIKPAGTTMMTIAEAGNVTVVNDVIVSGGDVQCLDVESAATGGADDITISPAGTAKFTVAEAGQIQINGVVSSHSACAAAGDRGKIELYSVANTVSFCGCWQSGVATYAWVALHAGGAC